MSPFLSGFADELVKTAALGGHLAELAGLGILAKPSLDELRGEHVDPARAAKMEVLGLGVLAAPSLLAMARRMRSAGLAAPTAARDLFRGLKR